MFLCLVFNGLHSETAVSTRANETFLVPSQTQAVPRVDFMDLAAKAGLNFHHVTGGDRSKEYILESTGSGVALLDYNNDGLLDIFLINGSTFEGFPKGAGTK